jgi:hypothetical protein
VDATVPMKDPDLGRGDPRGGFRPALVRRRGGRLVDRRGQARRPALESTKPFYFDNVIGMPFETTIAIERLIAAEVLGRHR